MNEQQLLDRIHCNPKVMVGKPVIKGTRITVDYILNLLGHGSTVEEILDEYEGITQEDIQACLLFASQSLSNTAFLPLTAETLYLTTILFSHGPCMSFLHYAIFVRLKVQGSPSEDCPFGGATPADR